MAITSFKCFHGASRGLNTFIFLLFVSFEGNAFHQCRDIVFSEPNTPSIDVLESDENISIKTGEVIKIALSAKTSPRGTWIYHSYKVIETPTEFYKINDEGALRLLKRTCGSSNGQMSAQFVFRAEKSGVVFLDIYYRTIFGKKEIFKQTQFRITVSQKENKKTSKP